MIEPIALLKSAITLPGVRIAPVPGRAAIAPAPRGQLPFLERARSQPQWRESLALVERYLPFTRRLVHAAGVVQAAGEPFASLHIINVGAVKTVALSASGREQVVGLLLPGEWIGFESIASGVHGCSAHAMDTCEIWSLRYDALLRVAAAVPAVLQSVWMAMSLQLERDREWRFSLCTLPADARVAEFVLSWMAAMSARDLRTDQIMLRLTRAETGTYLGMTLETVSRSFSHLERCGLIHFEDRGRRFFSVPRVAALTEFVRNIVDPPERKTLQ